MFSPLRSAPVLCALALALCCAGRALGSSVSYTGTLPTPESYVGFTLTVGGATAETVGLQTWGFGGGVNAAGQSIAPGGFDPLLALFSGTGPSATLIDGTSDNSANFGSFMGCPPAGTVAFSNGDNVCGDITMSFLLAPGTYTLILSDANYVPVAFSDNGTLGEGFADLTSGVFQTCDVSLSSGVTSCITPTDAWALDITGTDVTSSIVPEPASFLLLSSGLSGLGWLTRRRRSN